MWRMPSSLTALLIYLFCMSIHILHVYKIQNTMATGSNIVLQQEPVDKDIGRPPTSGVCNDGVSRLSLWPLHLVLSDSFI